MLQGIPGGAAAQHSPPRHSRVFFVPNRHPSTWAFFTLDMLEAANDLVECRSALKGSGISVQDFRTGEELKAKRAQWPFATVARARGQPCNSIGLA